MRVFELDTYVNTRVSQADKRRLAAIARLRGVTLSDLMREYIQRLITQAAA